MDIDEFLDNELSIIQEEPSSEVSFSKEIGKMDKYEQKFEEIISCIHKNDLKKAEELYSLVWETINQEKFAWKQNLYDILTDINSKLENALNEKHEEFEKKTILIREMIKRAKRHLSVNKSNSALSCYSEIIEIYNAIPDYFMGEKKHLYVNEILPLYKEVIDNVEHMFFTNIDSEIREIKSISDSVEADLKNKDIHSAIKNYSKSLSIFNSIPNGYFIQKTKLSKKLLELYKEISIIMEIDDLKSKIGEEFFENLDKGKKQKIGHEIINIPRLPSYPQDKAIVKNSLDSYSDLDKRPKKPFSPQNEDAYHFNKNESDNKKDLNCPEMDDKISINQDNLRTEKINYNTENFPHPSLNYNPSVKENKNNQGKTDSKLLFNDKKESLASVNNKDNDVNDNKAAKNGHEVSGSKMSSLNKNLEPSEDIKKELIKRKIDRIKLLIRKGNKEKAISSIDDLLRLEPTSPQAEELKKEALALADTAATLPELKKKHQDLSEKPQKRIKNHDVNKKESKIHSKEKILPLLKIEEKKDFPSGESSKELKSELIKRKIERIKIRERRGDYKTAKKEAEEILKLDENNPAAKETLRRISRNETKKNHENHPFKRIEAEEKKHKPKYTKEKNIREEPKHDLTGELKSELIKRKIDRAKLYIQKNMSLNAKKELNAIIRIDGDNAEAKKLLRNINY